MSDFDDTNDPTDPHIEDAFDRLRSDAASLDAMAPLQRVQDGKGRLPWLGIALGGGAVAAVLVLIGIFAFGGDGGEDVVAFEGGEPITGTVVDLEDLGPQRPASVEEIVDRPWSLEWFARSSGERRLLAPATIVFNSDRTVAATTGCRELGGRWTETEGRFATPSQGLTGGCADSLRPQDRRVSSVLEAFTASFAGDLLILRGEGGDVLALAHRSVDELWPDGLDLTQWALVESIGPAGGEPAFPGLPDWRPINLAFSSGRVAGSSSCTLFGGEFDATSGPLFTDLSWIDDDNCGPDFAATEIAFREVIGSVSTGAIEGGRLTLSGPQGQLIFEPEPPIDTAALSAVVWELDAYGLRPDGTGVTPVEQMLLEIRADRRIVSSGGCLDVSGGWVPVNGFVNVVAVPDLDLTSVFECEELSEQARDVVEVLAGSFEPVIRGDRLYLFGSRENTAVRYRATSLAPAESIEPTGDVLESTAWVLASGEAFGQAIEPSIEGDVISISFDAGVATFGSECERSSSAFTLSGPSISWPDDDAMTAEDCDNGFREAVVASDTIALTRQADGTLELRLSARLLTDLRFVEAGDFAPDEPDEHLDEQPGSKEAALEAVTWRLVDVASLGFPTDGVTISFIGGTFTGQAHCNAYGGDYQLDGETIVIEAIEAEEEGCALSAAEAAYFDALMSADLIGVDGEALIINVGPDELLFEAALADEIAGGPDRLSVDELLNRRPEGVVLVDATVVEYDDGTVLLCDEVDDVIPPRCPRWVVVTNYDAEVDGNPRFFNSGFLRDDGRFQVADRGADGLERRPVEVTQADAAILDELVGGPTDFGAFEWADEVELWLGPWNMEARTSAQMLDPANWVFAVEGFEGFAGPFDIVATLAGAEAVEPIIGPHDHCAGQPRLLPESLWGLGQLSIQPILIDSCVNWFDVSVFVNTDGQIEALMLDLFGP